MWLDEITYLAMHAQLRFSRKNSIKRREETKKCALANANNLSMMRRASAAIHSSDQIRWRTLTPKDNTRKIIIAILNERKKKTVCVDFIPALALDRTQSNRGCANDTRICELENKKTYNGRNEDEKKEKKQEKNVSKKRQHTRRMMDYPFGCCWCDCPGFNFINK